MRECSWRQSECEHCRAAERVQAARKAYVDALEAVAEAAEGFVSADDAAIAALRDGIVRAVLRLWDADAERQQAIVDLETGE